MWLLYYFNFERSYDILKSRTPCTSLNKNTNFDKSETESKMENPTHSRRETRLVFQLIWELSIKSKTMMSWSSLKKKEGILCAVYFVRTKFFWNICVLSQCIVCWIHFHNMHTFTYQKTLPHTRFYLFLLGSLQCILKFADSKMIQIKT